MPGVIAFGHWAHRNRQRNIIFYVNLFLLLCSCSKNNAIDVQALDALINGQTTKHLKFVRYE